MPRAYFPTVLALSAAIAAACGGRPATSTPLNASDDGSPRFPTAAEVEAARRRFRDEGRTDSFAVAAADCATGLLPPTVTCMDAGEAAVQLYSLDADLRAAGSECARDADCRCGAGRQTGADGLPCDLSADWQEACANGHCARAPRSAFTEEPAHCPPLTTIVARESRPGEFYRSSVGVFAAAQTRAARAADSRTCCYLSTPTCPWAPRPNE
jgi:hypothetical protein